jgi:tight adherence protein B
VFSEENSVYLIYALVALASIMVVETVFLLVSQRGEKRDAVNRRMRLASEADTRREVFQLLKKERDIDGEARLLSFAGVKRLRAQSGMRMPLARFLAITTAIAAGAGLLAVFKGLPAIAGLGISLICIAVIPLMSMRWLRKRRLNTFGLQLPEALELITRGLKAGHPVPVAVSMVGREMTDPIGSEFGMVADEITYGSDLVSALKSMLRRVGHEDLPLFITAVGIQATSGGNLREILDGLSKTIRERGKLRRKIRAISAEGRISAYILTAVPVLLLTVILVFMPHYYEAVWGEPLTWYLLAFAVFWTIVGNVVMFRMANFKF